MKNRKFGEKDNKCYPLKQKAFAFLFAAIIFLGVSFLWIYFGILSIICIFIGLFFLNRYYDSYIQEVQERIAILKSKKSLETNKLVSKKSDTQFHFPTIIDHFYLYRTYIEEVAVPQEHISKIIQGNGLEFLHEPDNIYDENALKIICKEVCIGYVYRGLIQDMIHDFQKKNLPIIAFYNGTKLRDDKIVYMYTISFYKDLNLLHYKLFNLDKINLKDSYTNEPRKESFYLLSPGDILELDYNSRDEEYFVSYVDNYGCIYELGTFHDESLSDSLLQFAIVDNVVYDPQQALTIKVHYTN